MELFLYMLLLFTVLCMAALTLPVKIFINIKGGSDSCFDASGKIGIYSGLLGFGFTYTDGNLYHVQMFLFNWRMFSINVTSLIRYFARKTHEKPAKESGDKEKKKVKVKIPFNDRLKSLMQKATTYRGFIKEAYGEFNKIVRFDRFDSHITLGLWSPAFTGILTGIIFAVNGVLPKSCSISPTWDFTKEVIRGDLSVSITFFSHRFWRMLVQQVTKYTARNLKNRKVLSTGNVLEQEV